ncbi:hypothetical protein JCM1840_006409 [Sporobolomyces johnsonii]
MAASDAGSYPSSSSYARRSRPSPAGGKPGFSFPPHPYAAATNTQPRARESLPDPSPEGRLMKELELTPEERHPFGHLLHLYDPLPFGHVFRHFDHVLRPFNHVFWPFELNRLVFHLYLYLAPLCHFSKVGNPGQGRHYPQQLYLHRRI